MKLLRIIFFIILLNLFLGCATKKIYEREVIREGQFERKLGPRDAAVLRYGHKGIEENIVVESPSIFPSEVSPGGTIRQEIRYGLLSENSDDRFIVTESVVVLIDNDPLELLNQQSEKEQGIHQSIIQITLPVDIMPGQYQLITTLSAGGIKRKVSVGFVVK